MSKKEEELSKEAAELLAGEDQRVRDIVHKVRLLEVSLHQERISTLQAESKQLGEDNKLLKTELEQQRADEADIYYYLHKKLDDNYDVIAGLEKQILTEQTDRERTEKNYQKQIEELRQEHHSLASELREQLTEKEEKLYNLKDFQEKKEELEKQFKDLREELAREKESHKSSTAELERRNVQEKEKLKKEMLIKIKETKQNLLSMTEDQLHTTTKRTIMENEQMITELQYQSKETEKLLHKNERLETEKRALRRELQLSRETEQELAKRTQFYQKLIKKLHEKLKMKEEMESKREVEEKEEGARLESVTEANQEVIAALQDKAAQLEIHMEEVCAELEASRLELQGVQDERNRMLTLQDETVRFLLTSMQDVSAQIEKSSQQSGDANGRHENMSRPASMDELTPLQRQRILRLLLSKLYAFQTSLKNRPSDSGLEQPSILPPIPGGGSGSATGQRLGGAVAGSSIMSIGAALGIETDSVGTRGVGSGDPPRDTSTVAVQTSTSSKFMPSQLQQASTKHIAQSSFGRKPHPGNRFGTGRHY